MTEGEVTRANSTCGRQPKGSVAVEAVLWSLSDLDTTQKIRGLVPTPVYCTTAIKVSKYISNALHDHNAVHKAGS